MFEIKGLKKLEQKLQKMQRGVEKMAGDRVIKVDIHDYEIFTEKFLKAHTKFVDFTDYEAKTKDMNLHENVEFIQQNTEFSSFQEMIDAGKEEIDPSVVEAKEREALKSVEVELKRALR